MATNTEVIKEIRRRGQHDLTEQELALREELEATAAAVPAVPPNVQEQMRADLEKAKATGEWTVRDAAMALDIPPGFLLTINGKPYVTKEGLLIRAQKKGFRSIQTLPVQERDDPEDPYFEFEAKIYPNFSDKDYELLISMRGIDRDSFRKVFEDLMRPTIARGYACKENVRNPELVRQKQLKNLAETRALCRALRVYTGCGLTAFEELPEVGG